MEQSTIGVPPSRGSILLVEHEPGMALAICQQLTTLGYQLCGCVDSGSAAIAAIETLAPDLVLINAALPGAYSGISAAEAITGKFKIPLVFLSAATDPATVDRSLQAQPYAYVTKPFHLGELYAQIEIALSKARLDRQVRDALQWYTATLSGVADSVIATDANGLVRFLNPAAERLMGWTQAQALKEDIDQVLQLQDGACGKLTSPLPRLLAEGPQQPPPHDLRLRPRSGAAIPVEETVAPIYSEQGVLLGAVMVLRDLRQRTAAAQQLRHSEERFRNAFDLAPGGMAVAALDGRLLQVNAALCRLLQTEPAQLSGRRLDDYAASTDSMAPQLQALRANQHASIEFEQRLQVGEAAAATEVWALVSVSLLHQTAAADTLLFQLHDMTERKRAEQRLARLAHYDALTSLPNRVAISEEIERQIALARRYGHRLAVLFLDIDYFKHVNDSLGHAAGDELLRLIARRLRTAVRESDMVGRLGGDEFVVVLPEIAELGDILSVANKMQTECLKPITMLGHELRIGLSLGASLYPDDALDAPSLLRYADSAMYQAKATGRGNFQFYHRAMTYAMEQRLRLGASLRRAIERDEFELYFQPIVALDTLQTHAAEALLRWNHPELGALAPDQFLALAEDIGLSNELGGWVINAACHAAMAWPALEPAPQLAINVSPSQFRDTQLVTLIRLALAASGLPPHRLCVEITEQLMLGDTQHNREILQELRALGIQISIDDFGTGYSSLSYLSHFNPNEMKIDRSLVEHVCENTEHGTIVRAAVAMAHGLQLRVVAEGIETAPQQEMLRSLGCDLGQGFWYLKPCPAAQFHRWLAAQGAGLH